MGPLSRTHAIIIGSCAAALVAAIVIIGLIARSRRTAAPVQSGLQVVVGSAQLYTPPTASAPPLDDCSHLSLEISKPPAAHFQMYPLQ
jgi:hypothetical protein